MKIADKFDARCLRERPERRWRWRLLGALGALASGSGILLLLAALAALLGQASPLASAPSAEAGALLAGLSIALFATGLGLWRKARYKLRRQDQLAFAAHLLKRKGRSG